MKRKVYYVALCSPLTIGERAIVVPLNHSSDLVTNGHECVTTPVQAIDGSTFETWNSIYFLAEKPDEEMRSESDEATSNHSATI